MLGLWFFLSSPVQAAQIAGVEFRDTATVGGQELSCNGVGLREKFFIDVYAAALYLPAKTKYAPDAITKDVPKRLVMHFIDKSVTAEQLAESYDEGLAKTKDGNAYRSQFSELNAMMEDVGTGDRIVLDYAPGTGTTVTVKGRVKGRRFV